jgi:phage terminase small subunit
MELKSLCGELGLTPAALSRLKPDEEASELDKFNMVG